MTQNKTYEQRKKALLSLFCFPCCCSAGMFKDWGLMKEGEKVKKRKKEL
jgi:hypothetical protein